MSTVDAVWVGPGPVTIPGHGDVQPGDIVPIPEGEARDSANWRVPEAAPSARRSPDPDQEA